MSKTIVIVYAMVAVTLFGGAIYARDDYTAHLLHDQARTRVDDTMLTIFVPPVGAVMWITDEIGIFLVSQSRE